MQKEKSKQTKNKQTKKEQTSKKIKTIMKAQKKKLDKAASAKITTKQIYKQPKQEQNSKELKI